MWTVHISTYQIKVEQLKLKAFVFVHEGDWWSATGAGEGTQGEGEGWGQVVGCIEEPHREHQGGREEEEAIGEVFGRCKGLVLFLHFLFLFLFLPISLSFD